MVDWNQDVISEILEQLWLLHTTSWESEFRPEATRRFFSNYSLVSKLWTLPGQRYVYRNAHLRWGNDWLSFQAGVNNPERGLFLQQSVRILELHISHSKMGIPVQRLDKIIGYCPNLVELRLVTGREINSLFLKKPQQSRLRSNFNAIRPTIRALQLRCDGRNRKTQVLKQIGELIPFNTLDFLSISSDDGGLYIPTLDPTEWDVRNAGWNSIQWPIETNAHTIPLRCALDRAEDEEVVLPPPPVYPHTLRFNATELHPWYSPHPFLELLGPRLKHVMFQTMFDQARWNKDCEVAVESCPELEQMVIVDCHWSQGRTQPAPRLYVLEPQDWHIPLKEDETVSDEENKDTATAPGTRVMTYGDVLQTASHMVCFVEKASKKWLKEKNPVEFRKPLMFDPRWLQEALTGQTELRSSNDMKHTYAMCWSDTLIDRSSQYMVALRRPSTLVESE